MGKNGLGADFSLKSLLYIYAESIGSGAVASPWADWAIAPAAHSSSTLVAGSHALYIKLVRTGPTVIIYHHFSPHITDTRPRDEELIKIRAIRGFDVDDSGSLRAKGGEKWRVGVMACGENNESGTVVEFSNFSFGYL